MNNNYPHLTQSQIDIISTIMDDEVREMLHGKPGLDTPGAFLTAYIEADASILDVLDQYDTGGNI